MFSWLGRITNAALKPLELRVVRLRDVSGSDTDRQLFSEHPVGHAANRLIQPLGLRVIQRKHLAYYDLQSGRPSTLAAPAARRSTVIMSDDTLPLHILNEIYRSIRVPHPGLTEATRTERDLHIARYNEAVNELHHCFMAYAFPEIPPREHRGTLLTCLLGTNVAEAMWLLRALHQSLHVPGDVCEFGCAHGSTSALLANEIAPTDKALWLFDSFKGLSRPTSEDTLLDDIFNLGSMAEYEGTMAYSADVVREKLLAVRFPEDRTHIVPGYIEQSLKQASALPEAVCCAYVDFDLYEPVLTALEFLSERVPVGGHIVVDDYGFLSSGVQKAVDQFVRAQNDAYRLELPPVWAGRFAVLARQ